MTTTSNQPSAEIKNEIARSAILDNWKEEEPIDENSHDDDEEERINIESFVDYVFAAVEEKKKKLTDAQRRELASTASLLSDYLNTSLNSLEKVGDLALQILEITKLEINAISCIIFDACDDRCPFTKSWMARIIKDAKGRKSNESYASIEKITRRLCVLPLLGTKHEEIIERKKIIIDDFPFGTYRTEADTLLKKAKTEEFSIENGDRATLQKLCDLLVHKEAKPKDPNMTSLLSQFERTVTHFKSLSTFCSALNANVEFDIQGTFTIKQFLGELVAKLEQLKQSENDRKEKEKRDRQLVVERARRRISRGKKRRK